MLVVGIHVSARISHKNFSVGISNSFRLIPHGYCGFHCVCVEVHFIDRAFGRCRSLVVGIGIRGNISIIAVEGYETTGRNIDRSHMFAGFGIHNLNKIRTVYNGIDLVFVNLYVVSRIAETESNVRVNGRKQIEIEAAVAVIEIIQRGFVRVHLPFVQHKNAFLRNILLRSGYISARNVDFRGFVVFGAGCKLKSRRQSQNGNRT